MNRTSSGKIYGMIMSALKPVQSWMGYPISHICEKRFEGGRPTLRSMY